MISILAALAFLGQSTGNAQPSPPAEYKAPSIRYADCRCPDEVEADIVTLVGLVIDAEVTLSADGLSPSDRQATIFNVTSSGIDVKGRTKIWHRTDIAQCGVNFDYGKKYSIAVRRAEEGFETDECLMRRLRTAE